MSIPWSVYLTITGLFIGCGAIGYFYSYLQLAFKQYIEAAGA